MRALIAALLCTFVSLSALAQSTDEDIDTAAPPLFRPAHAVKFTPALQSYPDFHFMGGNLHFESALRWRHTTLDLSFRYHRGSDTTNLPPGIERYTPAHYRLDIEPKFWISETFRGLSVGGVFSVYHTFDLAGGFNFRYLIPFAKRPLGNHYLYIEPGIGLYSISIENYGGAPPVYIRYLLTIGFHWDRSQNQPQ
jgi:hypothetical protein